jgi:hypothetical protein
MGGVNVENYESIKIPVEKQCGIIAVARLLDISVKDMVALIDPIARESFTMRYNKAPDESINWKEAVESHGLDCYHLIYLVRKFNNDLECDCRYCSPEIDIKSKRPLMSFHTGLVALKFHTPTHRTHWTCFIDGKIIDGDDVFDGVEDIKKKYNKFDGFGHKPIFIHKEDSDLLSHFFLNPCHQYDEECNYCIRKSFCLERDIYEGNLRKFRKTPYPDCDTVPGNNKKIQQEFVKHCHSRRFD